MRTTTLGELTDAFAARIRQITPGTTARADQPWRFVEEIEQVSGEIRVFTVDVVDAVPVDGGIYSPDAIEHDATALVYTCYGNLPRRQVRALVAEDARQVWLDLAMRADADTENTIAGLVSIEHVGWQDESEEPAQIWGAHIYAVRFLAQGLPPS